MLATIGKLLALLDRGERIQLALLFVAVLSMAFLEMVSIAAVLPFLSLAADPSQLQGNRWFAWAYDAFGFTSPASFLIALGALAVAALLLSNAWMAATTWAQWRFAFGRMHQLGVRLLRHYSAQPYVFFLRRNSADCSKNVLDEVEEVATHTLMPALRLLARAAVVLAIIGLLVGFDPALALLVALVLGGAYVGIYLVLERRLTRQGSERLAANADRYKAASEFFGAIKEVKLLGREDAFVGAFIGPSTRFARHRASAHIIAETPRYVLEALAFSGVLLIAIYLLGRGGSLQQVIPVLGLYAFAGYRLMPNLQQVYAALTTIRFGTAAVDNLHRELTTGPAALRRAPAVLRGNGHAIDKMSLTDRLELDRITFTYPGTPKPALDDLLLTIEANTTVGIVGRTGSGKTTLVDVILGLLRPQQGEIRVDGVPLTDANLRAWQNGLGYVPQHIYLSDDTIARNIAFGIAPGRIDMAAVERAARLAQLHEFIVDELPEGYATTVGERGICLSGGQRQRLGIARTLYHDPGVLVLDEATSSLDNTTEAAVIAAIQTLAGTRTIIAIAHRLTTLCACDVIHKLEARRLATSCAYDVVAGRESPLAQLGGA